MLLLHVTALLRSQKVGIAYLCRSIVKYLLRISKLNNINCFLNYLYAVIKDLLDHHYLK